MATTEVTVWSDRVRDVIGVATAAIGLLLLAPVLLVVAILVRLDSPGPILFRQERIGRNRRRRGRPAPTRTEPRQADDRGRPFTFYKFRTMYVDARTRFPHLYDIEHTDEALRSLPIKVLMHKGEWDGDQMDSAARDQALLGTDPRVTRVGRWLRRTSLDELPNLFNVLKGDMHLVGPRPDIAANIRHYKAHELRILDVKPGVTGLAQVEGRGLLSFEATNALDLKYLQVRSLWIDCRILLRTVHELIRARGAY